MNGNRPEGLERSASIIRVTRTVEQGTTLAATSKRLTLRRNAGSPILVTLMMEAVHSFETSVLARATRRNIPENGILEVGYTLNGTKQTKLHPETKYFRPMIDC
jgi:hypothetical protein